MFIHEFQNDLWMRDDALYAQGQWTMNRLTLQGGLRFDRAWSWAPDAAGRKVALPPRAAGLSRRPRAWTATRICSRASSATYDVFGNGKTALKGNVGKYLEATITGVELRHREPDVAHRAERLAQLDRQQRQLENPTAIC